MSREETILKEFTKSKIGLHSRLQLLKKFGVLKESLSSMNCSSNKELLLNLNPNSFEVLEFYGDSVLYERITRMLLQTRRFCSPHILSIMRSFCVQNRTLAAVFDSLSLHRLSSSPISPSFLTEKQKGDIVEAIVGELAEYESKNGDSIILNHCKQALDELIGYIFYAGESAYFFTVHNSQNNGKKEENDEKKHNFEDQKPKDAGSSESSLSQKEDIHNGTLLTGYKKKKRKKKKYIRETRVRRTYSKFSPIRQARLVRKNSIEEEEEVVFEDESNEQQKHIGLISPAFFQTS